MVTPQKKGESDCLHFTMVDDDDSIGSEELSEEELLTSRRSPVNLVRLLGHAFCARWPPVIQHAPRAIAALLALPAFFAAVWAALGAPSAVARCAGVSVVGAWLHCVELQVSTGFLLSC